MSSIDRADGDRRPAAAVPEPADGDPVVRGVPAPDRWSSPMPAIAMVLAVLVLPLVLATSLTWGAVPASGPARAAVARVVSAADLESEYGIRITLVGVTAAGGLVDLRFSVVDREKALHVFHDATTMPTLFVEATGSLLKSPKPMAHKMTVLDGASYFFLYPNSGGAIQRGTKVSVVIDDIRSEPIDAQS